MHLILPLLPKKKDAFNIDYVFFQMSLIKVLIKVSIFALFILTVCSASGHDIDRGDIKNVIVGQMANHRGQSNSAFRDTLLGHLSFNYPHHWFTVVAYPEAHGFSQHALYALRAVFIFRQYGRNVVVAWTSKSKSAQNAHTQYQFYMATLNEITNKVIFLVHA